MGKYNELESYVQCPFFMTLRAGSIVCESPLEHAKNTVTSFGSQERRMLHLLRHCNEIDGGGCPLYRAVMAKYED